MSDIDDPKAPVRGVFIRGAVIKLVDRMAGNFGRGQLVDRGGARILTESIELPGQPRVDPGGPVPRPCRRKSKPLVTSAAEPEIEMPIDVALRQSADGDDPL